MRAYVCLRADRQTKIIYLCTLTEREIHIYIIKIDNIKSSPLTTNIYCLKTAASRNVELSSVLNNNSYLSLSLGKSNGKNINIPVTSKFKLTIRFNPQDRYVNWLISSAFEKNNSLDQSTRVKP